MRIMVLGSVIFLKKSIASFIPAKHAGGKGKTRFFSSQNSV
jgi:hypothetical protein